TTAPTFSGFRVLSNRDHAAPIEKPTTPIFRPDTGGIDLRYSAAPKTIFLILSSAIFDLSSFASATVFARPPSWRSGDNTTNPWDDSLLEKLLKKSLSPHQACRTRTAPRGFSGVTRKPCPCLPSASDSAIRLFSVVLPALESVGVVCADAVGVQIVVCAAPSSSIASHPRCSKRSRHFLPAFSA